MPATTDRQTHGFGLKPTPMLKKKQPFFLIIALITLTALSFFSGRKKPHKIHIDTSLQEQFFRLDSLLSSAGVVIDYTKIDKIITAPLASGKQGVYFPDSRVLIINSNLRLPPVMLFGPRVDILQMVEDYALVVMAHEVMHSQGVLHVPDPNSIMFPSDTFTIANLTIKGPENYILEAYCKLDSLRAQYPIQ